jgi:hypothetical protein
MNLSCASKFIKDNKDSIPSDNPSLRTTTEVPHLEMLLVLARP